MSHPVPGVPPEELVFNFRSGRLCLAFVATIGERWRGNFERLPTPADLTRWFRECGMVETDVRVTPSGLRSARELPEAIYRQAKREIAGRVGSAEDDALISQAAAHPDLVPVLRAGRSSLVAPPRGAERAALSTLARDAIDMFAHSDPGRLRECESPECGLLFLDTSRPGKRRWCSSDACGGRARAAAYRRRSAQHGDAESHPSSR